MCEGRSKEGGSKERSQGEGGLDVEKESGREGGKVEMSVHWVSEEGKKYRTKDRGEVRNE